MADGRSGTTPEQRPAPMPRRTPRTPGCCAGSAGGWPCGAAARRSSCCSPWASPSGSPSAIRSPPGAIAEARARAAAVAEYIEGGGRVRRGATGHHDDRPRLVDLRVPRLPRGWASIPRSWAPRSSQRRYRPTRARSAGRSGAAWTSRSSASMAHRGASSPNGAASATASRTPSRCSRTARPNSARSTRWRWCSSAACCWRCWARWSWARSTRAARWCPSASRSPIDAWRSAVSGSSRRTRATSCGPR